VSLTKQLAKIAALRKHGFHVDALELESRLFHEFLARAHDAYLEQHNETKRTELLRDQTLAHRELVMRRDDA
jgi:hypothetical protein